MPIGWRLETLLQAKTTDGSVLNVFLELVFKPTLIVGFIVLGGVFSVHFVVLFDCF